MGLTQKDARNRLEKHGPNVIRGSKKKSAISIFVAQFMDFMILILLISTAVSAFMGEVTEAITIIAIVVVNAILGFIQEYRTERTMEALKSLAAPSAKVIRDGCLTVIPAHEVVPGDLIVLEAGDRVPADSVLTEAYNMQIDESLLTGESIPVEKSAEGKGNSLGDIAKNSSVYMGTIVTSGKGKAIVYATGMNTEMGKIADMIQNVENDETPLQKKLAHLGKFIAYGCIAICIIVSVAGILRGYELFTMLLSGISLAVAAVPEGLPAIVTISLALGVQRMLKKNALVRKLPAVETLGCASVICSDKTGTLTENKMTVRKIYAAENIYEVGGIGYNLSGEFMLKGRNIEPDKKNALKLALEIGAMCNNAEMIEEDDQRKGAIRKIASNFNKKHRMKIVGDPTENALLVAAYKAGITPETLSRKYYRIDEIPFDSDRKCMSVICRSDKGETYVFTKGAPDIIIEKCTKVLTSSGEQKLSKLAKDSIMKVNNDMARDALRVLGVAYRKLSSSSLKKEQAETDLVFVGLMGMIDPPRKEAVEAVAKCRLAGIKPVMITGDHKITATAIAKELNIFTEGDKVLTGEDLEKMSETELQKIANEVSVYARVSPKHKLMIVRALKRNGNVVAMTGDGVNDAPAVKEADIGVSMGISGTDVTKEASSMILLDDNFATIVAAVEEGRTIYNNIRKFIRYLLSCNIGEVLTMFLGMVLGLPLPLLPIQILWVNLVTDGLPAIALGLEPPDRDVMTRPPRKSSNNIFSDGLLNLILFRGILLGLSTLAVFSSILYFRGDLDAARTSGFVTLVITQLMHVFECKSEDKNIFEVPYFNNKALIGAVSCSLCMILSAVYIPQMQRIFKTVPLNLNDWVLILGFSALGPVVSSFFKVNKLGGKKRKKLLDAGKH